jgi:U3 small nucleolar RNA-associated protein 10
MSTRSDEPIERRRALEVILQLVGRLGEEYVILLPEAMPFLAELLEDPELHIQNGTRALLRKLEEITGENLDDYLKM